MSETDSPDGDHRYFRAIEDTFIELRGAPLLLSPADWRVAQRWRRQGIPLELVRSVLEEVFAQRRERGTEGKVRSLRYCAEAVEAAWKEIEELSAPGRRTVAEEEIPVGDRLCELAASLPPGLGDRERWVERLLALGGGAAAVERRLEHLENELLAAQEATLSEDLASQVENRVEGALARLSSRFTADELEELRPRLRRKALRRVLQLPTLSLFATD